MRKIEIYFSFKSNLNKNQVTYIIIVQIIRFWIIEQYQLQMFHFHQHLNLLQIRLIDNQNFEILPNHLILLKLFHSSKQLINSFVAFKFVLHLQKPLD